MAQEIYNVIGVMSGTSLDGIDLAHIRLKVSNQNWNFELFESQTVAYNSEWVNTLKSAVDFDQARLTSLNKAYTNLLAGVIGTFIEKHKITDIDAVCSHGHTILHQPQNGFTLQIGNLPEIATQIGQKVICDFRIADVKLGGQGAPLVPIGDRLLFSEYDYCLNLGGFSNISFEKHETRIAFDISAVNTVLNFYANKVDKNYDDKGAIAASGTVDNQLLGELNAMDYYLKPYPKSLGFEYVKQTILPIMESNKLSTEDKMRTFVEHIAIQIAVALPIKSGKMLITGGGAYNDFLIKRIKNSLPEMKLVIPDKKLLEFKEALIFALLGVLKLRNDVNVLCSVTGASHNHSSGVIYTP